MTQTHSDADSYEAHLGNFTISCRGIQHSTQQGKTSQTFWEMRFEPDIQLSNILLLLNAIAKYQAYLFAFLDYVNKKGLSSENKERQKY